MTKRTWFCESSGFSGCFIKMGIMEPIVLKTVARCRRMSSQKPLAENLRARGGNLLAATAAYNAGLSRTYTSRSGYEPYGQMPPFRETVAYLSRIVVNHHEIARRM